MQQQHMIGSLTTLSLVLDCARNDIHKYITKSKYTRIEDERRWKTRHRRRDRRRRAERTAALRHPLRSTLAYSLLSPIASTVFYSNPTDNATILIIICYIFCRKRKKDMTSTSGAAQSRAPSTYSVIVLLPNK